MTEARAAAVDAFFATKGWTAFPFQHETWRLMGEGRSGLVHATTGAGKTVAVGFGAWLAFGGESPPPQGGRGVKGPSGADVATSLPEQEETALTVLWVTPMRALAADSERALRDAFDGVAARDARGAPAWTVGARTGDTSPAERARQARRPPRLLVTTPESLSLMLSRPEARDTFVSLRLVVVDEWHELLGNKRGVLTSSRSRAFAPSARTS